MHSNSIAAFFLSCCGASLDTSASLLDKMQQSNIGGERIAGNTRYSSSSSVVPLQLSSSARSFSFLISPLFVRLSRRIAAAAVSTSTTQTAARKTTTDDDEMN
jgi:hypothetical protein